MMLSNYKYIQIRIQNYRILFQQCFFEQNQDPRNSINSTTRNRLLLQVIHFRNAFEAVTLQSSQRLPELLFYTKKSYRILQAPIPAPIPAPALHVHIPENSPSRIQLYMQKTKSSSSTTVQFQKFYA